MKKILIIFSLAIVLFSCSTDVELNADYKDITVIYGLLNKNTSQQYIKVNKAFLGDASVAEMASVSDSFIYKNANVFLKKYKNGSLLKTINFVYNDTIQKDTGFFANDKNVIYITNEKIIEDNELNNLDEYKYELVVKIEGKPEVKSETKLVADVRIQYPQSYQNIMFYQSSGINTGFYKEQRLDFKSAKNSILNEVYVEINFYEKDFGSTDYKLRTLSWKQLDKRATTDVGGENLRSYVSGSGFYYYVHTQVENNNVEERVFYSVRFFFVTAGESLTKYIDLTTPSYGIVQEKPSYTNIENGWGLFSSRSSKYSAYHILESSSLQHLNDFNQSDKFIPANMVQPFYLANPNLDPQDLYQ